MRVKYKTFTLAVAVLFAVNLPPTSAEPSQKECYPCHIQHRDFGSNPCPKRSVDCGPCKKGYEEIPKGEGEFKCAKFLSENDEVGHDGEHVDFVDYDDAVPVQNWDDDSEKQTCYPCEVRKRLKGDVTCPKSEADCGNCLHGFEEVERLDGDKFCSRVFVDAEDADIAADDNKTGSSDDNGKDANATQDQKIPTGTGGEKAPAKRKGGLSAGAIVGIFIAAAAVVVGLIILVVRRTGARLTLHQLGRRGLPVVDITGESRTDEENEANRDKHQQQTNPRPGILYEPVPRQ